MLKLTLALSGRRVKGKLGFFIHFAGWDNIRVGSNTRFICQRLSRINEED